MDHTQTTPLTPQDMTDVILIGAPIYGTEDEKIGTISHLHGSPPVTHVVVDVGGLLGIGAKPVLLSVEQLNLMRDEDGEVHGFTTWTKDQITALPEYRY